MTSVPEQSEWRLHDWITDALCHENELTLLSEERKLLAEDYPTEPASDLGDLLVTHTSRRFNARSILQGTRAHSAGLWAFAEINPHIDPQSRPGFELGLEEFVSAYLGVHDPLAVGARDPIGIFLRPDCDASSPTAHILFRDPRSFCPFPSGGAFCKLPAEAKAGLVFSVSGLASILMCEIKRKGGGDPSGYWGDPRSDEFKRRFKSGGCGWSHKMVYQKYQHVSPDDFVAILYPSRLYDDPVTGQLTREIATDQLAQEMSKIYGEKLIVYEFRKNQLEEFVLSSWAVAKYLELFGELPLSAAIAVREVEAQMKRSDVG